MDSSGIGIILGRYKKIACFGGKVYAINADNRIQLLHRHFSRISSQTYSAFSISSRKASDLLAFSGNSESFEDLYNTLLALVGPSVAQAYYDDGYEAYRQENYADAITVCSCTYVNRYVMIYFIRKPYHKVIVDHFKIFHVM